MTTMITDKGRPFRILIVILFIIYLVLVPVWVLFFKADAGMFYADYWKNKGLIGIDTLEHFTDYANLDPTRIIVGDMILNVFAFMPFGIYLEMLFHDKSVLTKIMSVAAVSMAIEIMQFTFGFGEADIVDLIANSLGGIIGIILIKIIYDNKNMKTMMVLAIVTTVAVTIAVGIHTVNSYYRLENFYGKDTYGVYLEGVQKITSTFSQDG